MANLNKCGLNGLVLESIAERGRHGNLSLSLKGVGELKTPLFLAPRRWSRALLWCWPLQPDFEPIPSSRQFRVSKLFRRFTINIRDHIAAFPKAEAWLPPFHAEEHPQVGLSYRSIIGVLQGAKDPTCEACVPISQQGTLAAILVVDEGQRRQGGVARVHHCSSTTLQTYVAQTPILEPCRVWNVSNTRVCTCIFRSCNVHVCHVHGDGTVSMQHSYKPSKFLDIGAISKLKQTCSLQDYQCKFKKL